MRKWLTVDQAAEALGLHRSTVIRQIGEGTIRGARRVGRQWRIPAAAVEPPPSVPAPAPLDDVEAARAAATAAALALSAACMGWPLDRDRLDAARLAFDVADQARIAAEKRAGLLEARSAAALGCVLSQTP